MIYNPQHCSSNKASRTRLTQIHTKTFKGNTKGIQKDDSLVLGILINSGSHMSFVICMLNTTEAKKLISTVNYQFSR